LLEKQVAQLSLTNPRDALHHDKRQNFKRVTFASGPSGGVAA